ncbi:hypothetical protein [Pendulispora albinea]|uniref:Uncharacterized protein n=1 Tax=Pendulispora albinea TaxID=2741071 RepID=A0ABZ2LPK0_9BACT
MTSSVRTWKWTAPSAGALCASLLLASALISTACGLEEGGFGAAPGSAGPPGPANPGNAGGDGGTTSPGKGDPTCVPTAETCNGRDDDCNGVPDEGCPQCDGPNGRCTVAMTFTGTGGSGPLGYPLQGGDIFDDTCGEGEAVVGVDAQYGDYVDQVRTWCVKLEVRREVAAPEYKYSVVWREEPLFRFPAHGAGGPNAATVQCKKPKLAVGLSLVGRQVNGGRIAKVEFACAEVGILGLPGVARLVYTNPTPEKVEGARVGMGTALPPYSTPPGSIIHGLYGQPPDARDFLYALGTRDQALSITPLPPVSPVSAVAPLRSSLSSR